MTGTDSVMARGTDRESESHRWREREAQIGRTHAIVRRIDSESDRHK